MDAAQVIAKTLIAEKHPLTYEQHVLMAGALAVCLEKAVSSERERCARLCDRLSNDWHGHDGKYALEDAANKIREHNQTITPSDES